MNDYYNNLPGFHTINSDGEAEIRVKKSRFIAHVAPIENEADANLIISEIGKKYHDCRHVCHAWIIGSASEQRTYSNDDGEPNGSAGEPILRALKKAEITNCVAVVIRYFGGVKLGTGGLGRAYKECAELAIEQCEKRFVPIGNDFVISFHYTILGSVEHLIEKYYGKTTSRLFDETVTLEIWLPCGKEKGFEEKITELSAGKIKMRAKP